MSSTRCQEHSISQGGQLFFFLFLSLFSILVTVLLYDADMDSRRCGALNLPAALVNDLVYADDALVVAVEQERAELQINCIARAGSNYALTFNWAQVELMPSRCQASILKPNGCEIPNKSSSVYLGSSLSASGDIISEVRRRLGLARADFTVLESEFGNIPH